MENGYCATGKEAAVPIKALVVEDSDIIQLVYQRYLEDIGYQVDIAENGYQALELAAQSDYDCVLLDIGLPDISGESVLSEIRYREQKTGKRLPIIVNSAHADEALLQRCCENGADAALPKPLTPEDLSRVLSAFQPSTTAGGTQMEGQSGASDA